MNTGEHGWRNRGWEGAGMGLWAGKRHEEGGAGGGACQRCTTGELAGGNACPTGGPAASGGDEDRRELAGGNACPTGGPAASGGDEDRRELAGGTACPTGGPKAGWRVSGRGADWRGSTWVHEFTYRGPCVVSRCGRYRWRWGRRVRRLRGGWRRDRRGRR